MRLLVVIIIALFLCFAVLVDSNNGHQSNANDEIFYNKLRHMLSDELTKRKFFEMRKTDEGLAHPAIPCSMPTVMCILTSHNTEWRPKSLYKLSRYMRCRCRSSNQNIINKEIKCELLIFILIYHRFPFVFSFLIVYFLIALSHVLCFS